MILFKRFAPSVIIAQQSFIYSIEHLEKFNKEVADFFYLRQYALLITLWGYSSAGRALDLHSKGQEFDSPYLHQKSSPNPN